LAIDATAARRHFAALLLCLPNVILTCLLRAKTNNNRAFHRNGAEAEGAGRYLSNREEIGT